MKAFDTVKNVDTIITRSQHAHDDERPEGVREFNRDFLAAVRGAKKAGKSVDDVANSWKMPAKYTGYAAPQPARLKSNVQVIYDELK